jgi:hypothetical protein
MKGFDSFAVAIAATVSAVTAQVNVPEGAIVVPMIRNEDQSAYLAELQVGTPSQTVWLKVDTGSPTYSFIDPRNDVCARPVQPCEEYGAFDNITSSYVRLCLMFRGSNVANFNHLRTSFYEGTGFHNALNNHGLGDYLNDTVGIGGVSTDHMYFGYLTHFGFPDRVQNPFHSILGMFILQRFQNSVPFP